MWTAIKKRSAKEADELIFVFVFTDNVSQKVEKIFRYKSFSLDQLKRDVQNQLNQFEAQEDATTKLPPDGDFDTTPDLPTPEQNARNLYVFMLNRLRQYKRAIEAGVTDQSNKDFTDAQAYLVANFRPEYIDLF